MEPPLSVCQRLFKEEDQDAQEKEEDTKGDGASWLVLSASQRVSLRERGFVVLDALCPASLAAEAYEEVRIQRAPADEKRTIPAEAFLFRRHCRA